MKQYISIIILVLICFSCEQRLKLNKPENLISKEKMVDVLSDMFIVTAAKGIDRKKFEVRGINPEKYILDKYNIDSTQFANSNNYYAHDIDAYTTIMEDIKTKINADKASYTQIEEEEKAERLRIQDSIKNLRKEQRANPNLNKGGLLREQN